MFRHLGLLAIGFAILSPMPSAKADSIKVNFCPDGSVHGGWESDTASGVNTVGAGCWNGFQNMPGGGAGQGSGGGSAGGAGLGGGGGGQTSSSNTPTVDKSKSKAPPCLRVGDPIDPASGAKVIMSTDFAMPGEMGLKFERYYMSRGIHGNANGGPGWTDNLDYELHSVCLGTGDQSCTTATFMRPDGSQLKFTQPNAAANGAFLEGPFTEIGGGGLAKLMYTPNGSGPGTYTLVDENGMVYAWSEDPTAGVFPSNKGILTTIRDVSGIGWTITHPSSEVTVVTHTSGRRMTLTVTGSNGGVTALTVTDPSGNQYVYQGAVANTTTWDLIPMSLASVQLPGSTPITIQYVYKVFDPNSGHAFPKGLTEVDYNGVAHDLTAYDINGNAISTSLADGSQKTTLAYSSNGTGAVVTITNPLGHVSTYQYNADALPISVAGQASESCAATLSQMTYDANGFMKSEVDNNSNTTDYTYSATGQLLQKVEAVGTTVARTINYVWDSTPGTDRLLSVTVAGWSQTSYTYNAQNRLASVSVKNLSANGSSGQTLTTTYQYTLYANGMVKTMTVTRPSSGNSDTTRYGYDALGNLTLVANGLGQTTTYSNYTALGEPGKIVGPNGDETDFTYDGRGLLLTKTTHPDGGTAQWVYTYDQFGQVNQVTAPDGEVTKWARNASGVLKTITHTDKEGTATETFGYDANGDVTSHTIVRGSDTGLSESATYDELGRLLQKKGSHGQTLTYAYDPNGNVLSVRNALGHATTYQYDALNRVTKITESGGATLDVSAPNVPANSTTGSYTVSWSGVSGATSYILQEQANGGGWSTAYTGAATSKAFTGKTNGTYGYRLQACNAGGCGGWSAVASVSVLLPPPEPSSLSIPATSTGSVAVSWAAASTATHYVLQHADYGVTGWSTIYSGSATSYTQHETVSGAWIYEVQACNSNGCSAFRVSSGGVTVTVPPASAPSLSVPVSSGNGSYAVSWSSVSGATSYTLQEQINGGSWSSIYTGSAKSWSASGYAASAYGYRVQACNASGCSGWSGVKTTAVSIPLTLNGQSYTATNLIDTGGKASGAVGIRIVNGTTWQVYNPFFKFRHGVMASGSIPAAARTVTYTWTYVGVPSGYDDGDGNVFNGAASPVAVSSNPWAEYSTIAVSGASAVFGRTYSVRVDFYNAMGVNISSSTCNMTAEVEGSL